MKSMPNGSRAMNEPLCLIDTDVTYKLILVEHLQVQIRPRQVLMAERVRSKINLMLQYWE